MSYSKNPSGINYNIASVNNYDRYYHEIVTANIFLVLIHSLTHSLTHSLAYSRR